MPRVLKYVCAVALALGLAGLLRGALPQVPSGMWMNSASMAETRAGASAVLLAGGQVLVTGGSGASGAPSATAEIFTTNGSFSAVAPMSTPRSGHISLVLRDGRVLVAGGVVSGGGTTNSAEIYNPASNSWSSVPGGMIEARSGHTATLLQDGRILIAGGAGNGSTSASVEIYDPAADRFSFAGALLSPRQQHAAALLPDGRVLIAGGASSGAASAALASTDVFDPATGLISGGPSLGVARAGLSATALLNGDVLVAGGGNGGGDLASAEVYDAVLGRFDTLAGGMAVPRRDASAFLLPHNNTVLVAGGTSNSVAAAWAELYVPWSRSFVPTGVPLAVRRRAAGSPLSINGLLMLAGGEGLATSELYGFATVTTDKADYAPGQLVTVRGSGWQPGETVTLTFVESPLVDTHAALSAVADSRGNIFSAGFSPDDHDIGVRFYLTATGASSQAQTTFTDDLPLPTVQFSATVSSGDESSTPTNLAVSLSAISGSIVTVHYSVTGGTATGGGVDYTLAAGTLTFNPGDTLLNIPIAVTDDVLDELDENILVSLDTPTNATLGGITSHTYTIEDNDPRPTAQFFLTSSSGLESSTPANLEVKLSAVSGKTVTVGYSVGGGTATAGGVDYTSLGGGTLTFAPGETSKSIQLSVVDDSFYEADETIVATILFMTNANPGANMVHTYTILNNDDPPTVQFTVPNSSGDEGTTPASLAVALSTASSFTVNVNYAVTGGTATGGGVDYTLASGMLTFNPGDTANNIQLSVVNDLLNESNETVEVTLSSPTNATLGASAVHTYTILDNDPVPTVQFNLITSTGPESSTPVNIEVKLSAVSGQTVGVNYAATGGTATGGGIDYALASGSLSFAPGVTVLNIPIAINDDLLYESNETVEVTLSAPVHATLGANTVHTYTILDNDPPPTVQFTLTSSSGAESISPANLAVQLSAASGLPVSVHYAVTGGAATDPADYSLLGTGTLTFSPGDVSKNVQLSVVDDLLDEPDETVEVTLSVPTNATLGGNTVHTYTILDNDDPPTVSINVVSALEGNSPGTTPFGFTVGLSAASGQTVTVKYATADGTATTADNDYVAIPATLLTFAPGETSKPVVVTVNRDNTNEADETFFVNLSDLTNLASMGNDVQGMGGITNDDPVPTVQFNLITSTGPESSTPVNIEVKLSAVSGQTVTVDYAATGGTATGGGIDYTLASATLSFALGVTVLNIPVTIIDDLLNEAPETIEVTLSAPVHATLGANTLHTYTIVDNDPRPTISIDDVSHLEGNSPGTTAFGFTVSLSAPSGQTVTVNYSTADNTATTADNDYVGIPATLLTFAPGETSKPVVVTVNGDNTYENDETLFVNLSDLTNLAAMGNDLQGIGTITNDDMRLTVTKVVINNNGGTKEVGDFPLFVDDAPVTSGVPISLGAGAHTVSETGDPGYTATFGGDCALNGTVTLSPGEAKTCTVTNDDIERGTIIVEKQTLPHGVAGEFTFTGNAAGVIHDGEQIAVPNLLPGSYTSTETVPSGWDLTAIVCSDNNSMFDLGTHTATFHLEAGETVTCTFTDTKRGKLLVDKVTSPGGDPTNFTFTPSGFNGETPFLLADASTPFDSGALLPGIYSVTETVPSGWDLTAMVCSDNNSMFDLGTHTATFHLEAGETVTCTFIDTKTATIKIDKQTVGGPASFSYTTVGTGPGGFTGGFSRNTSPTNPTNSTAFAFNGTQMGVKEIKETALAGYTLTNIVCSGGTTSIGTGEGGGFANNGLDTFNPGDDTVRATLSPGDVVTCTFTNTKVQAQAQLTVTKIVVNDNGGTKVVSDFPLYVDGTPVTSGVPVTVNAGSHTVSEHGSSVYMPTIDGDCATNGTIVLNPGDVKSCTITNNDIAPRLIVVKHVVNKYDGNKQARDFTMTVTGSAVFGGTVSFSGAESPGVTTALQVGSYIVSESGPNGYDSSFSSYCSGSITLGQVKTCTVTNTEKKKSYPPPSATNFTQQCISQLTQWANTITCTLPAPSAEGNFYGLVAAWPSAAATVLSITDADENVFQSVDPAGSRVTGISRRGQAWFAKDVRGGTAPNVVTILLSAPVAYPWLKVVEYSGIDQVTPIDGLPVIATGNGTAVNASITTTNASDTLLTLVAHFTFTPVMSPGSQFTMRGPVNQTNVFAQDRTVAAAGTYSAGMNRALETAPWYAVVLALRHSAP